MPRERSPKREKAFELWSQSNGQKPLQDIADELDVSASQIRNWKVKDKWEDVLAQSFNSCATNQNATINSVMNDCATNQKTKSKKKGAPFGSQNAKGHGAPKGNKNAIGNRGGPGGPFGNKKAVTTGEYETIWFDCLTEEEQILYDKIDTDPLAQVESDIKFFTVRERRMMERIRRLMDGLSEKERKVLHELQTQKNPVTFYDEKSGSSKVLMVPETKLVVTEITETECRLIDDILKLEEALTRVQDKKTKAIALKHTIEVTGNIEMEKLQLSKARLLLDIEKAKGESKSNQHVDALRQKMNERKKQNGSS